MRQPIQPIVRRVLLEQVEGVDSSLMEVLTEHWSDPARHTSPVLIRRLRMENGLSGSLSSSVDGPWAVGRTR